MLAGTEGGSLVSLSVTTASGQLLQGPGDAGAINMLPAEGGLTHSICQVSPDLSPHPTW